MCHVVDEVVFHLRQLLLAEDNEDGEDEGNQQDQREDHRGHDEVDRALYVVALRREIDPEVVQLRGWVVWEKHLGHHVGGNRLVVDLCALIHHVTIFINNGKDIGKVQPVVQKLSLQVIIQFLEIQTLLNRL